MTTPDKTARQDLKALTEARLTFGPRGRTLDTGTSLQFSLDHAKAREAVLSELDVPRITNALSAAGLDNHVVTSAAATRDVFIKRPDLGRQLPDEAMGALTDLPQPDVAIVLGDGLSAIAASLNGTAFVITLVDLLAAHNLTVGPVICARQARVALGDKLAIAMDAPTVVMALGERPGLSAADSLGVYITQAPTHSTQDSERNCISNIREGGTHPKDAAEQATQLILSMRQLGVSGVALNSARATGQLQGSSD